MSKGETSLVFFCRPGSLHSPSAPRWCPRPPGSALAWTPPAPACRLGRTAGSVSARHWRTMSGSVGDYSPVCTSRIGGQCISAVSCQSSILPHPLCPAAECPEGLVHHDCFLHTCEQSCSSTRSGSASCPPLQVQACIPNRATKKYLFLEWCVLPWLLLSLWAGERGRLLSRALPM